MGDNRLWGWKRDREENDEFMPISKRMKSIHINEVDSANCTDSTTKVVDADIVFEGQMRIEESRENPTPTVHSPRFIVEPQLSEHQRMLLEQQEEFLTRQREIDDRLQDEQGENSGEGDDIAHKNQTNRYEPTFDCLLNHNYYEINKQLFYAHQDSLKRTHNN